MKVLYKEEHDESRDFILPSLDAKFLGKSIDYWITLQNNAKKLRVDVLIDRIAKLEYQLNQVKRIVNYEKL